MRCIVHRRCRIPRIRRYLKETSYSGSSPMNKRISCYAVARFPVVLLAQPGRNSWSRSQGTGRKPFRSPSCRSCRRSAGCGDLRRGAAGERRSGPQRPLQDHGPQGHDRAAAQRAPTSPSTIGGGSTTTTSSSGSCPADGPGSLQHHLRALQRAHRQRLLGFQITANQAGLAARQPSGRRHGVREDTRHPRRLRDAHRLYLGAGVICRIGAIGSSSPTPMARIRMW